MENETALIAEQDGARMVAKLTPKGRALLDQLRTEQQREQTDDLDDNS